MIYKNQIVADEEEKHEQQESYEEEEPTQPTEEEKSKAPQIVQYTLPCLRFDFELGKDVVVSMLAVGENSDQARQSFCLLIELLNEKINLNNKEPSKKKESYIG